MALNSLMSLSFDLFVRLDFAVKNKYILSLLVTSSCEPPQDEIQPQRDCLCNTSSPRPLPATTFMHPVGK